MSDFVSVRELAYASNLELLAGEAGLDAKIAEDMISRPGLEFTGFLENTKHGG